MGCGHSKIEETKFDRDEKLKRNQFPNNGMTKIDMPKPQGGNHGNIELDYSNIISYLESNYTGGDNKINYSEVNSSVKNLKKYYKNQLPPSNPEELFVDELFPPNLDSINSKKKEGGWVDEDRSRSSIFQYNEDDIVWLRPKDIFLDGVYTLFESDLNIDDFCQGYVGDCYFVSSLSSLSEFPQIILQLFKSHEVQENGCYEIALRCDGEWKIVIIDDLFPCSKDKKPLFLKSRHPEIWPMLFEKAWAKVNGGYANINAGGGMCDVYELLTTFPSNYDIINDSWTQEQLENLWTKINEGNKKKWIMTTSTNDQLKNSDCGLVAGHAYSLLDSYSINSKGKDTRLVKLRNPWGGTEWKGAWSDGSGEWTEETRKLLLLNQKDKNDGIFFMEWKDLLDEFNFFCFNEVSPIYVYKTFHVPQERIETFNLAEIEIQNDSEVRVSIYRKFWRLHRKIMNENEVSHTVMILKKNVDEETGNTSLKFIKCKNNYYDMDGGLKLLLEKGSYIIFYNINYNKGKYDKKRKYNLTVGSSNYFELFDLGSDDNLDVFKNIVNQVKIDNTLWENNYWFLYDTIEGHNFESDFKSINNSVDFEYDHNKINNISTNKIKIESEFIYNSYLKFDFSKYYKTIDSNEILMNYLKKNYPNEVEELLQMPPLNDSIKVTFKDPEHWDGGFYLGERTLDGSQRHGRGMYKFTGGCKEIGYFVNNEFDRELTFKLDPLGHRDFKKLESKYKEDVDKVMALKPLGDGIEVILSERVYWDGGYHFGEWTLDGKERHGRGMYKWDTGAESVGYFLNNELDYEFTNQFLEN